MGDKKKPDKEILKALESLLDAGSFVETLAYAADADVSTGYGTVYGRLVFVYLQYGAVNAKHAKKIQSLYDNALKMGAPVIGFLNSKGMKLDEKKEKNETIGVFDAYGSIFAKQAEARGIIPQIGVVMGNCLGMSSIIASLSDFVFAHSKSRIFFSSPNTYSDFAQSLVNPADDVAGAEFCCKSGLVHIAGSENLLDLVRELISYLPSNALESARDAFADDLNRIDESLNGLNEKDGYDMKQIIRSIADSGAFYELKEKYCRNAVTGFCRFNGYTAGIIALKGQFTTSSMSKTIEFVELCDKFNIPLVTLSDVDGFDGGVGEDTGIMKSVADMYRTFKGASVPKVNVIVNKAYGASYFIANSIHCGADAVYAWCGAKVSAINPQAASAVLKMKIDDAPENTAALGYIDNIIEPAETRKRIIASLEMLSSKRIGHGGKTWKI